MTHFAAVWTAADLQAISDPLRRRLIESPCALDAAAASYAPPKAAVLLLGDRARATYFVQLGRGAAGSPELHSAGPGFLLSAGGVAPPRTREIGVRPIVLLLDDGSHSRDACFHIPVGVNGHANANRTGVYHRFACADAPVVVPDEFQTACAGDGWRIYRPLPDRDLLVAIHNRDGLGLLAVFPDSGRTADALLRALHTANADADLGSHFTFPDTGENVGYDVSAPRTAWVMTTANGEPLPRDYTRWPRLDGWVKAPGWTP